MNMSYIPSFGIIYVSMEGSPTAPFVTPTLQMKTCEIPRHFETEVSASLLSLQFRAVTFVTPQERAHTVEMVFFEIIHLMVCMEKMKAGTLTRSDIVGFQHHNYFTIVSSRPYETEELEGCRLILLNGKSTPLMYEFVNLFNCKYNPESASEVYVSPLMLPSISCREIVCEYPLGLKSWALPQVPDYFRRGVTIRKTDMSFLGTILKRHGVNTDVYVDVQKIVCPLNLPLQMDDEYVPMAFFIQVEKLMRRIQKFYDIPPEVNPIPGTSEEETQERHLREALSLMRIS